jgi:hypothetical protein
MTHMCMYQWRGVRREGQNKLEKVSLNRKVSIRRHVETIAAKYLDNSQVQSESVDSRNGLVVHIRQNISTKQACEAKIR